jgi:hypothetical protein
MNKRESKNYGPFTEWVGDHIQLDGWGPVGSSHKFIFFHIPKTAGVSIASALSMNCLQCHNSANQIKQILNKTEFGKKVWQEYFKFSFVRNPWSWVVSNIQYVANCLGVDVDSSAFLTRWMNDKKIRVVDKFTADVSAFLERSQYTFLSEGESKDGGLLVDFVGKFENLQQDFDYICNKVGVPQKMLLHENKTKQYKHYSEYYNEDTEQFIASKFAKDIEYFGYEFER